MRSKGRTNNVTGWKGAYLVSAALLVCAAGTAFMVHKHRASAPVEAGVDLQETGAISPASQLGPSGLPLPRFVTLKANKVNVRRGPSSDHAVAWVYQRKGLPVEITAEFENWRRIRDADGEEGWILQSMLSGRRNALVADWAKGKAVNLFADNAEKSGVVARLSTGVVAEIESCDGDWCYVTADGYEGYARQAELWGVYPGEKVD